MKEQLNQVLEFHKKFEYSYSKDLTIPSYETSLLRVKLMEEELKEVKTELLQVNEFRNLDRVAKELCDLLYVTYGTIITYGLQNKIEECFNEVHKNNLSKVDDNGVPIYREDGKLIKPINYIPVDLKPILFKVRKKLVGDGDE